jgi:hypothetical protein
MAAVSVSPDRLTSRVESANDKSVRLGERTVRCEVGCFIRTWPWSQLVASCLMERYLHR